MKDLPVQADLADGAPAQTAPAPSAPTLPAPAAPESADTALLRALRRPPVRLRGVVGEGMLDALHNAILVDRDDAPFVMEIMTTGGDAEVGRRLAMEARGLTASRTNRVVFLGSTVVYSAGVTAMSGFPVADRFITPDTVLLIHQRRMSRDIHLNGPMNACRQVLSEYVEEIEIGLRLEREGFEALIDGSDVSLDELYEKADAAWYIEAEEALRRGLVAAIWDGASLRTEPKAARP